MKHANIAIFVPHLGCPHACSFCNQREISGSEAAPTADFVRQTAEKALGEMGSRAQDAEIAFFGGSFTAIEPEYMISLLRAAAPYTGKGRFRGIRVSTRPDAIDSKILDTLEEYNVTAIELGAQSMDDRVLALNHRGHTAQDVRNASGLIRGREFELGLQMMTGLYGETPEGSAMTAREIIMLRPDTVRIYPTIVVEGTELAGLYRSGRYRPQTLDEAVNLCAGLLGLFEREGIRVIRLGLHAGASLQSSMIAGPWHPAFRELCESRLYLEKARSVLQGFRGDAVIYVNPADISKFVGQHRANIEKLCREFDIDIRVKAADIPRGELKLETKK